MLRECDYSQALLEQVNQAISNKTPLVIQEAIAKPFRSPCHRANAGCALSSRHCELRPDRVGDHRSCRNAADGD